VKLTLLGMVTIVGVLAAVVLIFLVAKSPVETFLLQTTDKR
jgi:hypothetical protein